MQANELTTQTSIYLNEDTGADTASETLTYTRLEETVNRSTYGETESHTGGHVHSVSMRNQLQFYRTYPKRSGSSRGAAKLTAKWTRDIEVPNADGSGNIVLPLIGELSFSIPVGASHEEVSNLRRRIWANIYASASTAAEDTSVFQLLTEGLQI
jgi:hypothetical protein